MLCTDAVLMVSMGVWCAHEAVFTVSLGVPYPLMFHREVTSAVLRATYHAVE